MRRVFCLLLLAAAPVLATWPNGYTFRRTITVDHTRVADNLINFPVMIAGSFTFLATQANGGNTASASGFDMIVTSDAAGLNPLSFERVAWSALTGTTILIASVPAVSASQDTLVYLFYGNPGVTTDQQNKTGVWDSGYQGVFHLSENTSGTTVADSSAKLHSGTNATPTAQRSVPGPFQAGTLGSGLQYNGSSDYTDLGASPDWDVTTGNATWEMWIRPGAISTYATFLSHGLYAADGYYFSWSNQAVNPGGALAFNAGVQTGVLVTPPFVNGVWFHAVFVKQGTAGNWFVNGAPLESSGVFANVLSSARHLYLGRDDSGQGGSALWISEFRISNVARSAAWIAASYSNQSDPADFCRVGPAEALIAGAGISVISIL